jgi:glycine oxidase
MVGSACARELAASGRSVLVLDDGARGGEAFRASAGLLAAQINADRDDRIFELGIAGREYYRDMAPQLKESVRLEIGLWESGILQVALTAPEAQRLRENVAWQRQHGHQCDWLDPAELASEWPAVGSGGALGALWAPQEAVVDPIQLVAALRADATRLGATFVSETVAQLEVANGRVQGVVGRTRHSAGVVVLAAGAWTGRLGGLPRPVSVEPVKGQMAAFPWPAEVPPLVAYGSGVYLLHRNGEAWCGSTVEHTGFSLDSTDEAAAAIAEQARAVLPALPVTPPVRHWSGLRPGTPDGLPILGKEPNVDGLWYATGHGRNGVLLAGITGVVLTHLMNGEATYEEVEYLKPERFWSW